MIQVTRLNNETFYVNPDQIEFIEETPDTVVSLESGRKLVVMESTQEIINRIVQYKQRVLAGYRFVENSGRK